MKDSQPGQIHQCVVRTWGECNELPPNTVTTANQFYYIYTSKLSQNSYLSKSIFSAWLMLVLCLNKIQLQGFSSLHELTRMPFHVNWKKCSINPKPLSEARSQFPSEIQLTLAQ